MKKTFLFRVYSVNTITLPLTEMTLNRKGSAMTTETLQFLKALYANETRQVWVFDETNTCIWKNDISKPLQSEDDCQALLKTVASNTGSQLFWHESLLYAAEVQQSTELHCTILKITTEPILTNIMKEKNFRGICQEFLANQREAVSQISVIAQQIYNEVESNNIGDLEQEAIFSDLNDVMHACCSMLQRTSYYTELGKYAESESMTLQPVELSRLLFDFSQNCKETLGRRISLKIQAETKIWVLCNEARLCFSLLCLMIQLLSHDPSQSKQAVFLHVFSERKTAILSIQTKKNESDFQKTESAILPQPNGEAAKRDYYLTNAVLQNFCKMYHANLESINTDTKQGYLLKIPLYNAYNNLQLHANIPRRRRSTFLNNYQIMLYDIADYRFY